MSAARGVLAAALAVATFGAHPARAQSQQGKVDTIDLTRPGTVTGKRFNMHQRVQVVIRNLNPFAGSYRVLVYEKSYADSAISQFLAGLGLTVPAGVPPSRGVSAAGLSGRSAGNTLTGFAAPLSRYAAGHCSPDCEAARSLVAQFLAFQDTLSRLEAQDDTVRSYYETVTSERADSASVMIALGRLVEIVTERVDSLHRRGPYLPTATRITDRATDLWGKLNCGGGGAADTVCLALGTVTGQKASLPVWAAWRDTLLIQEDRTLPALLLARHAAPQLFDQVLALGDYDYPTTADILIQRRPIAPIDLVALTSVLTGPPAPAPKDSGGGKGQGDAGNAASTDTSFAAGWRTVANPRLSFGQRRRIGLGGALVLGPEITTYGIVTTDATRVAITRREQAFVPLLTLTTRLAGWDLWGMGWAFNLHLGVTPSTTTRQTYFAGLGIAFADERMGLMVGYVSLPTQRLVAPDTVGWAVASGTTSAPTQDTRFTRLVVGFNLRPF